MKQFSALLFAILLAGCTGAHKQGVSRYDEYDAVKVDQMVGNNVSGKVFAKTIVCLNARRESRRVTALTNVSVVTLTNIVVTPVTNLTISIATNYAITAMTNLTPQNPLPALLAPTGDAVAATDPNTSTNPVSAGATATTNTTVSLAANASATTTPSQVAANHQLVRTYNNQITTTSNNFTVALMTNFVVTAETNAAVVWITNTTLATATNTVITPTNFLARDYFLFTEVIPPPDFTLATNDTLVVLADGARHAFTPATPQTALVSRKGFTTTLYRVPPEVLVALANAKEAKVRLKGTTSVIERTLSGSSKQNFKNFLVNFFSPEPASTGARKMAATDMEPTQSRATAGQTAALPVR